MLRDQVIERLGAIGQEATKEDIEENIAPIKARLRAHLSGDRREPGDPLLDQCQLIIGDEVGWYFEDQEGRMSDMLVAPVVPPFPHTFVDFRGVPNRIGVAEWGVFVSTLDFDDPKVSPNARKGAFGRWTTAPPDDARWLIAASVFGSWDGRDVVGPFGTAQLFLDDQGSVCRRALHESVEVEGTRFTDVVIMNWLFGGDSDFERLLAPEYRETLGSQVQELLYAALLTISFTHVKNVDVVEEQPDPKLSKAFRKRHGRPLKTRYLLDIGPMKRYLEGDGYASRQGLAKAMHVCRGHFKTYTSERPLFGSVTGTFWWPSSVRGSSSAGVVEKDYRVSTGESAQIARDWYDDDEHIALASHDGGSNPDLSGRGWRAHAVTLNAVARYLTEAGRTPMRARPDGPQFDLAYQLADGSWAVVEVKSITADDEVEQVRRGIGQVADYRQAVGLATGTDVAAVLVVEREGSARWDDVCAQAAVVIAWPGKLDRLPA